MSHKIAMAINILILIVLCLAFFAAVKGCISGTDVPRILPGDLVMF